MLDPQKSKHSRPPASVIPTVRSTPYQSQASTYSTSPAAVQSTAKPKGSYAMVNNYIQVALRLSTVCYVTVSSFSLL